MRARSNEAWVTETVAGVVAEVVGGGPVRPGDRFADLGGDSIQAVQVLSACWKEFGVELPIQALRPDTTVDELTAVVWRAITEGHAGAEPECHPAGADPDPGWRPASPRQAALYSFWQANPELPTYNVPVALRPRGPVDVGRLAWAAGELVRRHDALRTVFRADGDGRVLLKVLPDAAFRLAVIDRAGTGPVAGELGASEVEECATVRLDLASSPVHMRLIRTAADRCVLILVIHHIVCDGWALNILLRSLCRLYDEGPSGSPPPAGPPAARIAEWDARQLSTQDHEDLAKRWVRFLDGAPTVLELPADRPRPAQPVTRGRRIPLRVPAPLLARLRRQAATLGTTPFGLLATAFGLLLGRYTGQRDLVIGVPMANRYHPEAQRAVAYLSNTVPVRLDLRGRPSVREAVERIGRALATAEELSALPADAIAAAVHGTPGVPLFQVALVLLTNGADPLRVAGAEVERVDLGTGTAKFDQSWYLEQFGDALEGYVEFATELFDPASVERMRGHFDALLAALAGATAEDTVADLPMCGARERADLVARLCPAPAEPHGTIVDRFLDQVWHRPDRPAVWCAGTEVSYRELHAMSRRVARRLRAAGLRPGTLVGVCVPRSVDQVAAVVGILLAGGAFLPLDPAYPVERLRYMISDAGIGAAVTTAGHAGILAGAGAGDPIVVDQAPAEPGDRGDPPVPVRPESLAYVIYTSGSTGAPKGVELTHAGLANVIDRSRVAFGIDPASRVLQAVSPSFDAAVWETFMALGCGATLCLAPPDLNRAEHTLTEVIKAARPDVVFLPPAMLALVEPAEVPPVRVVITGGDRVPPDLRDRWAGRTRFFTAYGPTEGTIVQTWGRCPPGQRGQPPIGQPFAGVRLYVLDDDLEPVPYGAAGEVYVGGIAVARGYRGRGALTAERFLPDPFSPVPGGRMYRTGDIVRRRADGELTFVGRSDGQVKIRGFRIELGEVEAAILAEPGVAEALAIVDTGGAGQARLLACVVPREVPLHGPARFEHDLGRRLRARLPEHLVPAQIRAVPSLPRTANGKVDREAVLALGAGPEPLGELLDRLERLTDAEAELLLGQATGAHRDGGSR